MRIRSLYSPLGRIPVRVGIQVALRPPSLRSRSYSQVILFVIHKRQLKVATWVACQQLNGSCQTSSKHKGFLPMAPASPRVLSLEYTFTILSVVWHPWTCFRSSVDPCGRQRRSRPPRAAQVAPARSKLNKIKQSSGSQCVMIYGSIRCSETVGNANHDPCDLQPALRVVAMALMPTAPLSPQGHNNLASEMIVLGYHVQWRVGMPPGPI